MPKNKKEGIIYGISMCFIMVYFMGLLNISIHSGSLNLNVFLISLKAFPITFLIAFILENLVIHRINLILLNYFSEETDSTNAFILFNTFFIVTMMSFIMTILGGFLGGDHLNTIFNEFFIRWPRNFCAAFFLNILVAGPISRLVLKIINNKTETETAIN